MNSPYMRPGQRVEVEGVELEEEEISMKGWCQVRRKNSQEEKEVATMTRGWEELKRDMQDQADMPLIDTEDKITFCLSNLMLTGSATPYLHNGIMSADQEDATNFEVRIVTSVTCP